MFQAIWDYLGVHYPQVALYALITGVIIYSTVKVTKFYVATNHTNKEFPKIQGTLTSISTGLLTLNNILLEKEVIKQSCYSNANSPRVVNQLGEKVFVESKAKDAFEKLEPELIEALNKKEFNSLLELESQALNLLLEMRSRPEFKDIQNFAFEHPIYEEKPLAYSDILFIIALKLRDSYQKVHTERVLV